MKPDTAKVRLAALTVFVKRKFPASPSLETVGNFVLDSEVKGSLDT